MCWSLQEKGRPFQKKVGDPRDLKNRGPAGCIEGPMSHWEAHFTDWYPIIKMYHVTLFDQVPCPSRAYYSNYNPKQRQCMATFWFRKGHIPGVGPSPLRGDYTWSTAIRQVAETPSFPMHMRTFNM